MRSHESYADGWADAMQWAADHMRDAEDKAAAADILSSVADHWAEMQTEDYWSGLAKRSTSKQPSG